MEGFCKAREDRGRISIAVRDESFVGLEDDLFQLLILMTCYPLCTFYLAYRRRLAATKVLIQAEALA
jgi:hypothetical protein